MYVYLIIDKHEKVVKDSKDFSFIMYSVHLRASLPLSALPTIYSIVIFSEQVISTGKNKKSENYVKRWWLLHRLLKCLSLPLTRPCWGKFRQTTWPWNSDKGEVEMATNDTKMGWNCDSNREKCKYPLKPQYPRTNSPNWSPYISFKNKLREFD